MLKTKKQFKRLAALAVCVMMLGSTELLANAAKYPCTFKFFLKAGGDKQQTIIITKKNSLPTAFIDVTDYNNPSNYSLPYRLRFGSDSTAASGVYTASGKGLHTPSYYGGYGKINVPYYLKMQTDSSSLGGATIFGSWKP